MDAWEGEITEHERKRHARMGGEEAAKGSKRQRQQQPPQTKGECQLLHLLAVVSPSNNSNFRLSIVYWWLVMTIIVESVWQIGKRMGKMPVGF